MACSLSLVFLRTSLPGAPEATIRSLNGSGGHTAEAEPPLGITGVSVEVIGDLAHLAVVAPATCPESSVSRFAETFEHEVDRCLVWIDAMHPPDHHGRVADLAVSDPAGLVLEVPRGQLRRLAQLAGTLLLGHLTHRFTTLPTLTLLPTVGFERNTVPLGGP